MLIPLASNDLKVDPSQPPPFSMPSKLLILLGELTSYCFSASFAPRKYFLYLKAVVNLNLLSEILISLKKLKGKKMALQVVGQLFGLYLPIF